ncbi:hypothetical protein ACJJTC_012088 [Scirpophaga incertulas]
MNCKRCAELITDGVECSGCDEHFHFGPCSGLNETTYRTMGSKRKAAWRCSQCRVSVSPNTSDISTKILEELKNFRAENKSEFISVKADIQNTSVGVQDLQSKWNELQTRFSNLEDRVNTLENSSSLTLKLRSDLDAAKEVITTLQEENNTRDQYARMNNLEISGVPFVKNENLNTILHSVCNKVGISLDISTVDSIHRVRRFVNKPGDAAVQGAATSERPPAIIVKFTRRSCKDQLLAAVRARRGLTSADIGLDGPASNSNYSYLWTRDCKIFLRKNDTCKVILITKESDLKILK